MEDCKRRAYIKQQATTKKKQEGGQNLKGMGMANPSTKRKPLEKTDRLAKKPKVAPESVVELKTKMKKTATPLGQGRVMSLSPKNHPSSSVRILSMRWSSSRPSSQSTTMRT